MIVSVRVASSNASLPERLMNLSSALLPLPKMPSPPEAWSRTVWSLIELGSIRLSNVTLMVSGVTFDAGDRR